MSIPPLLNLCFSSHISISPLETVWLLKKNKQTWKGKKRKATQLFSQLGVLDINNPTSYYLGQHGRLVPKQPTVCFRVWLICQVECQQNQEQTHKTGGCKIGIVCVFIDRISGRSFMELCAAVMVQSIRPLVRWNIPPLPPFVTTVIGCFLSHVTL